MKKQKCLLVLISVFIISLSLNAIWDMEWQDGNDLNVIMTNYGIIGHNVFTGDAGGYWPSGYPNENYIYGAGIWFGGLVDYDNDGTLDTLVTVGYNPNYGASEMVPGDGSDGPEYNNAYNCVYKDGINWPPKDSEGEILFDSVISLSDMYCHFSDLDPEQHFTSENKPLGLDVQLFSYAYADYLVYFRMIVKNVRDDGKDIEDAYVAIALDNDIGNESGSAANDLLGFIDTLTDGGTLKQYDTGYQFQMSDEFGWAHTPKIISAVLLETPVATENIDLYHNGSYIINAGDPIGMTTFNSFTLATDPSTMQTRYQTLAGYDHLNFDPANPEASYKPFPDWPNQIAGYPGHTESEADGGDKRFIMSSGPFNIAYGDSIAYTFGLIINLYPPDVPISTEIAKTLWVNRLDLSYKLNFPADDDKITSDTSFLWTSTASSDSITIHISGRGTTDEYSYKTANTGSYTVQVDSLPDGYYNWIITDDIYNFSIGESFIVDKPDDNGTPIIDYLGRIEDDGNLIVKWTIRDVEDLPLYNTVYFINEFKDTIRKFIGYEDSICFDFSQYLNPGYYRIMLITVDNMNAADTAYAGWYNMEYSSAYENAIEHYSGNSAMTINAFITDSEKINSNEYLLYFMNPVSATLCPYNIFTMNGDSIVISDTADVEYVYTYYPEYTSQIINGISFIMEMQEYDVIPDSVKAINDVGSSCVDSLLVIENSSSKVIGARNIIIEWDEQGQDTVYPTIYCEGYENNTIPFDTIMGTYGYYFTDGTAKTIYADINTMMMYIGEYGIYRMTGRILPLFGDTAAIPEDGEVWKAFTTGDPYLPIYGDTFRFTIVNSKNINIADTDNNNLKISSLYNMGSGNVYLSIAGNTDVDLAIYDITGRHVDKLYKGNVLGQMNITYSINLPKGIYFIKDKVSDYNKKILILR